MIFTNTQDVLLELCPKWHPDTTHRSAEDALDGGQGASEASTSSSEATEAASGGRDTEMAGAGSAEVQGVEDSGDEPELVAPPPAK